MQAAEGFAAEYDLGGVPARCLADVMSANSVFSC